MVDYVLLYSNDGGEGGNGGDGDGGGGEGPGEVNSIRKRKFNDSTKLTRGGLYKRFWNIYRDIRRL